MRADLDDRLGRAGHWFGLSGSQCSRPYFICLYLRRSGLIFSDVGIVVLATDDRHRRLCEYGLWGWQRGDLDGHRRALRIYSSLFGLGRWTAGFGAGGEGGGGSSDYVSNVAFAGSTLTFTGVGSAFSTTVDLSGESLASQLDVDGKLSVPTYNIDSASFASRIGGGGGGRGGSGSSSY